MNPSISPIIGIAGSSAAFAKDIGCDVVIDYRSDDVTGQLRDALAGTKIRHVFDANNTVVSMKYLLPLLDSKDGARLVYTTIIDNPEEQDRLRAEAGVESEGVWVGDIHGTKPPGVPLPTDGSEVGGKMFGAVMSAVFERALQTGRFSGHPYTIVKGGLNGVYDALIELRDRKGGNTKFVTRIADT
jgi:NADPH:quinone reductase